MMLGGGVSIEEHIAEIRTGPKNERWRAAYSLAQAVRKQEAEKKLTRSSVESIIDLYRTAEQPKIRQYLALVLAEVPLSESIDALVSGLESDHPGVKVNSALALGRLQENARADRIKTEVRTKAPKVAELLTDNSTEVRRMAAFVLGSLGNKTVIDDLKNTLNDSADEVRWNGAIALGQLGSSAGESILIDVLDRALQKKFQDWKPNLRRNLLTNAIQSLEKLNSKKALSKIRQIKENDDDSKVRRAALQAIKSLEQS
jgi:HEAT repeat protein